jgi:uncharacterized protein (DUF934 family)
MSVIITDTGFSADTWNGSYVPLADLAANDDELGVDLPSTADPHALRGRLGSIPMIRVDFPAFNDGRGFTIARTLRALGYMGRLRAKGHVIADQYAMARRSGFDEVEISDDLATRQPEADWLRRANWRDHDYQSRLRA